MNGYYIFVTYIIIKSRQMTIINFCIIFKGYTIVFVKFSLPTIFLCTLSYYMCFILLVCWGLYKYT